MLVRGLAGDTGMFSVAFSADGTRVVTASNGSDGRAGTSNFVEIWDIRTQEVVRRFHSRLSR
jgi:outer membrane receptor protein involved in Fe transport